MMLEGNIELGLARNVVIILMGYFLGCGTYISSITILFLFQMTRWVVQVYVGCLILSDIVSIAIVVL